MKKERTSIYFVVISGMAECADPHCTALSTPSIQATEMKNTNKQSPFERFEEEFPDLFQQHPELRGVVRDSFCTIEEAILRFG